MFFLILFGFYNVFLTGRTAAKTTCSFNRTGRKFSSSYQVLTKKLCELRTPSEFCVLRVLCALCVSKQYD